MSKSFSESCLILLALMRTLYSLWPCHQAHRRKEDPPLPFAPTPCRLKLEPCRPHSLLFGPWGLLHLGNKVQLWLQIEQALGFASEFSEEPLSTTEVLLINAAVTPQSFKSPALLGATCCNPAGGHCLVSALLVPGSSHGPTRISGFTFCF